MGVGERVKNKVITNIFVKKAKRSRKCAVTYWNSSDQRKSRKTNQILQLNLTTLWRMTGSSSRQGAAEIFKSHIASTREHSKTMLQLELSVQELFHYKSDIWKAQFQTNSIQDETPHLKPTLFLFDLDAYKFNKIKWVIWAVSGFPFLCNQKPNKL